MNRFRLLAVLISISLLLTLFPASVVALSSHSTVSGTVSLPGNDVAPAGGVKVSLLVGTDNPAPMSKKDKVEVKSEIIIPEGQKSTSFSLNVPKCSNPKAKYSVYYTVGNGYAPFGWYSDSGTVAIKEKRTQIDLNAGNINSLNIQLLPGKVISGKIILGNTKITLPKEMKYTVTAIQKGSNNSSSEDDIIISGEVTVPAGANEAPYQLIVPPNSSDNGYMVFYTYRKDGYREAGYYHTGGTTRGDNTVTLLDVSQNASGIDLITMPFTVISGRLYLPDGLKAPEKGIEAVITAKNKGESQSKADDFSFSQSVTIAKDNSYVDYLLGVPVVSSDYRISYTVSKTAGYITEGFYSSEGTVTSESKATLLEVTNSPVSGINLTLQKKALPTETPKPTSVPTPTPKLDPNDAKYDLNGDGYINVYDLLDLAKVIVKKYEKDGFDKDLKQYDKKEVTKEDMKVFWEVFKPFTSNKYKIKWSENIKNWLGFGWPFDGDGFDWKNFNWEEYWKSFNWKDCNWKNFNQKDWDKFWEDWFKQYDKKDSGKSNGLKPGPISDKSKGKN